MTWFIALMLALAPAESRLTGLSVTSVADRTEVIILVDGTVTPRHFEIAEGNRIVLDIEGVANAPHIDMRSFNRGGVRELRVAPYQSNVARIVLALESRAEYEVTSEAGRIRVSFPSPTGAGSFQTWSHQIGESAPAASPQTPVTVPNATSFQQPELQDFTFVAEPLEIVLSIFSQLSGRNIIPTPGKAATPITISLTGVTWQTALQTILDANNLAMRESSPGVFIVEAAEDVAKRRVEMPVETRTFRVMHVNADSLRGAVAPMVRADSLGGTGVQVNRGNNTLVVTGTVAELERIESVIQNLDVPAPEVEINAKIAFVNRTALEAMGVTYDLKDSQGNQLNRLVGGFIDRNNDGVLDQTEATEEDVVLLGGNSIAALGNANSRVAGPALELVTSLVLGRHSLISFIEALQTVTLSDIQAQPHLRIADNRTATLQVGEQTPIRTIDAGAAGEAAVATVTFKDTGIRLNVTPQVSGDRVILTMFADRSNIGPVVADAITFQTQNVSTVVSVADGETVVIGGLTVIEKTKTRTGIPLLMDLPVIGKLFRNDLERENKQDLLIMVTPTIVRD